MPRPVYLTGKICSKLGFALRRAQVRAVCAAISLSFRPYTFFKTVVSGLEGATSVLGTLSAGGSVDLELSKLLINAVLSCFSKTCARAI